jgi:hypothetical protein
MVGNRKLDQDSVNGRIGIQGADNGQQVFLADIRRQPVRFGVHAGCEGLLSLVADIDLAGRVLADQDHRETRDKPMVCLQTGNVPGYALAQIRRKSLAVDNPGL